MTAATSIMLHTLRTTRDCMHTARHGFVRYLARHVPSPPGHSMNFCQSSRECPSGIRSQGMCWVVHTEEHKISLDVETRHVHPSGRRPSGFCMLSHRGCEPCTPPMHFNHTLDLSQKSSNCRRSTPTLINVTQDEMKHPSAN